MSNFTSPKLELDSFHCPHCETFAHQTWGALHWQSFDGEPEIIDKWRVCLCQRCKKFSLWIESDQIYPTIGQIPPPHIDMPDDIKSDYLEAANIYNRSPRGAVALLRLCLDKLVHDTLKKKGSINDAIGQLVKDGLDPDVQKALDIIRVIGNEAVHPGTMDLRDDHPTARTLFEIINYIIDDRIARPRKLSHLFNQLPAGKREEIAKRDLKSK